MSLETPLVKDAPGHTDDGDHYDDYDAVRVQNIFNHCPLEFLVIILQSSGLYLFECV